MHNKILITATFAATAALLTGCAAEPAGTADISEPAPVEETTTTATHSVQLDGDVTVADLSYCESADGTDVNLYTTPSFAGDVEVMEWSRPCVQVDNVYAVMSELPIEGDATGQGWMFADATELTTTDESPYDTAVALDSDNPNVQLPPQLEGWRGITWAASVVRNQREDVVLGLHLDGEPVTVIGSHELSENPGSQFITQEDPSIAGATEIRLADRVKPRSLLKPGGVVVLE